MKLLHITAICGCFALSPAVAQMPMTAKMLGDLCMVSCESLNGSGTLMEDLGKVDQCIGYLKGLAGAIQWAERVSKSKSNPSVSSKTVSGDERANPGAAISTGICLQKILADRTAKSPQEDQLLVESCSLAQWITQRPNLYNPPAVPVALKWMMATGCK